MEYPTLELFLKSFCIPQAMITRTRLATTPPDVLLRPPLDASFRLEDFGRADEAIRAGRRAALASLGRTPGDAGLKTRLPFA